jgi:hypothetical protein
MEDAIKRELPCLSNVILVGDKKKFITAFLTFKVDQLLLCLIRKWCNRCAIVFKSRKHDTKVLSNILWSCYFNITDVICLPLCRILWGERYNKSDINFLSHFFPVKLPIRFVRKSFGMSFAKFCFPILMGECLITKERIAIKSELDSWLIMIATFYLFKGRVRQRDRVADD